MKYLPFLDGKYSTAPGLTVLTKAEERADRLVFQQDDQYESFLANKEACRLEDIRKYYLESGLSPETMVQVNRFIVRQLTTEYPDQFRLSSSDKYILHNDRTGRTVVWLDDWITVTDNAYLSLFDALCSQVQEDLAVCQLESERDWLAAIHLTAPNHWSPADKIGKPFGAVHGVVPGMEKLNQRYLKMLSTVVHKGAFFRFAWGISTDRRLNHHPAPPPHYDPIDWQGRKVEADSPRLYLRVERQTLTGLPSCNAFLFTIRTYFYDIDELTAVEKTALASAVESMSAQSLEYKGLTDKVDILRSRLLG